MHVLVGGLMLFMPFHHLGPGQKSKAGPSLALPSCSSAWACACLGLPWPADHHLHHRDDPRHPRLRVSPVGSGRLIDFTAASRTLPSRIADRSYGLHCCARWAGDRSYGQASPAANRRLLSQLSLPQTVPALKPTCWPESSAPGHPQPGCRTRAACPTASCVPWARLPCAVARTFAQSSNDLVGRPADRSATTAFNESICKCLARSAEQRHQRDQGRLLSRNPSAAWAPASRHRPGARPFRPRG